MPLGHGATLTPEQELEYKKLTAKFSTNKGRVKLLGTCTGCGVGIPMGWAPLVTQWETIGTSGDFKRQIPKEFYCRKCPESALVEGTRKAHRRRKEQKVEEPVVVTTKLDPKEIAIKLLKAMSKTVAMGAKKIARLAEVEFSDTVVRILAKLREANKVKIMVVGDKKGWVRA